MLELDFEFIKYKSFIENNPRFSDFEKKFLSELISDYFEGKKKLRFSQEMKFDFSLKDEQKVTIDRMMLNPNLGFEVKLICRDILIQTYCFQNSAL